MKKGDTITAHRPKSKQLTHGKDYEVLECTVYGSQQNPFCVYIVIFDDTGKRRTFSLKSVINK